MHIVKFWGVFYSFAYSFRYKIGKISLFSPSWTPNHSFDCFSLTSKNSGGYRPHKWLLLVSIFENFTTLGHLELRNINDMSYTKLTWRMHEHIWRIHMTPCKTTPKSYMNELRFFITVTPSIACWSWVVVPGVVCIHPGQFDICRIIYISCTCFWSS